MDNFRCANCDREFDEDVKVWGGNICCDCSTAFVGGESEEKQRNTQWCSIQLKLNRSSMNLK